MSTPLWKRTAFRGVGLLCASALTVINPISPKHGLAAATVSVDVTHPVSVVASGAVGANTAVWDSQLLDSSTPSLVQNAGIGMLRFPGGSTADAYHWQTNSITPGQGGYANPGNTFDAFMQNLVRPSGTQAMITVNYGSNVAGTGGGDPSEAAGWVNYANKVKGYGIRNWEIGNEVYGNGYYGSQWETDLHSDHSPATYATNAVAFSRAMKAVDPTIKVGLVLTAPGAWPDGQGPQQWNPTVLSTACGAADFVSVHWYPQSPGAESDAGLLRSPYSGTSSAASIASMVSQLRTELNQYCGSHGAQMGIMVTESNSVSFNPGKQTTGPVNGLFLIADYMEWLKNGVQNVTWWDLRNGPAASNNNSASLAGNTSYGDYGLLSSGSGPEPAANTPFPSYTALSMLRSVLIPGATFVSASSALSDVPAYAIREPNGQLKLILINTNATTPYVVSPALTGFTAASAQVSSMSVSTSGITTSALSVSSGVFAYTMAPYSAAVITLTPSGIQTPAPISTPSPTNTPAVAPAVTSTPVSTSALVNSGASPLILGNFEGSNDGFSGNSAVPALGPSSWTDTVALGSSSLWVQYSIPTAWTEAQISRTVNTDLGAYHTLSASVYAKQPAAPAAGVKVRFMAQGADGQWYSSAYQTIPVGQRTAVSWNIGSIPRSPLKMVYVCWQYTTADTGSGNEIWIDDIQAS